MSLEEGLVVYTKGVSIKTAKNKTRIDYKMDRKSEYVCLLLGAASKDEVLTKQEALESLGDIGFIQIDFLYDYLGEPEALKLLEQYRTFIEQFKPSNADEAPVAKKENSENQTTSKTGR